MKFKGVSSKFLTKELENEMKLELEYLKLKVKNGELIGSKLLKVNNRIHMYIKYFLDKDYNEKIKEQKEINDEIKKHNKNKKSIEKLSNIIKKQSDAVFNELLCMHGIKIEFNEKFVKEVFEIMVKKMRDFGSYNTEKIVEEIIKLNKLSI